MASRGRNEGFAVLEEFVCQAIPGRPMTDRAQQIMRLARSQAELLGSEMIEPEHVLLALAEDDHGIAGRVLHKLAIRPEQLREAMQAFSPQGKAAAESVKRRSDSTSQMLLAAQNDAAGMPAHECVDAEHLLLALASLTDGRVPAILARCGVAGAKIREEVCSLSRLSS